MKHTDTTNCFECSGMNEDCIRLRKYVASDDETCIYKKIANLDVERFELDGKGVTLYNMLMEHLGRVYADEVKNMKPRQRESFLEERASLILSKFDKDIDYGYNLYDGRKE